MTVRIRIFLSWCRQDITLKQTLLRDLQPALRILTDLDVEWWEDSHLTCGEELVPGIVDQLGKADFGVLLLSTRYFGSPFIRKYELPKLVDQALPVALSPLPEFGPQHDLGGIERHLVFTQGSRSFAELPGPHRTRFANELAGSIRRRALGLNGYEPL